jgi:hypothetical protein
MYSEVTYTESLFIFIFCTLWYTMIERHSRRVELHFTMSKSIVLGHIQRFDYRSDNKCL